MSGRFVAGASWLVMNEDVLLVRTVCSGQALSSASNTLSFSGMSSNTASTTKSTSAMLSSSDVLVWILAGTACSSSSLASPRPRRTPRLIFTLARASSSVPFVQIIQHDIEAAKGELQCNAVAHEARADDSDLL